MECAKFQELLLDYSELAGEGRERVDLHAAQCATCREFLETLRSMDAVLVNQFAGRDVPAAFAPAVLRQARREAVVRRPSFIPEILDFAGWGAIVAVITFVAWWLEPLIPVPDTLALNWNVALVAGGAFVLIAIFMGLRSLAELKQ